MIIDGFLASIPILRDISAIDIITGITDQCHDLAFWICRIFFVQSEPLIIITQILDRWLLWRFQIDLHAIFFHRFDICTTYAFKYRFEFIGIDASLIEFQILIIYMVCVYISCIAFLSIIQLRIGIRIDFQRNRSSTPCLRIVSVIATEDDDRLVRFDIADRDLCYRCGNSACTIDYLIIIRSVFYKRFRIFVLSIHCFDMPYYRKGVIIILLQLLDLIQSTSSYDRDQIQCRTCLRFRGFSFYFQTWCYRIDHDTDLSGDWFACAIGCDDIH